MALQVGSRVGPYEITGSIGRGGMGEVFRARDSRLKRDVALKVLPDDLAGDAERAARFQREAELLATLTHSNIAAVYGLEDAASSPGPGSTRTLVMELVEGDTLADLIASGPLPVSRALGFARQIAEALDHAHERGVLHRDLKPANIKVTPEGQVKVLDFGLAKAMEPSSGISKQSPPTTAPTLTSPAVTQAGMLLGTAAYMSPEQARGAPLDRRADIWAFGCVLYEMLTGHRAFGGDTVSDAIASVLTRDPEWSLLPADTPPGARLLIEHCLTREPRERLRDIGDARHLLTAAAAHQPSADVGADRRRHSWVTRLAIAGWLVVAGLGLWTAFSPVPVVERPRVVSFEIPTPTTNDPLAAFRARPSLALSPNGETLVVVDPMGKLMVRRIGSTNLTTLATPVPAITPFFSPDGQQVGYFGGSPVSEGFEGASSSVPSVGISLRTTLISGGTNSIVLPDVQDIPGGVYRGATWLLDDTIVFSKADERGSSARARYSLKRVPASGGDITAIPSSPDLAYLWPQVLPDQEHVLCTTMALGEEQLFSLSVVSLRTGEHRLILADAFFGRYSQTGYLLFVRQGALRAQRFDPRTMVVDGPVEVIADSLQADAGNNLFGAEIAVADAADVVATIAPRPRELPLAIVDRSGVVQQRFSERRDFRQPRLSRDGKYLAIATDRPQRHLWTLDLDRQVLSMLTSAPDEDETPVWFPDGRRVAFSRSRNGQSAIVETAVDVPGDERVIYQDEHHKHVNDIAPDGSYLIYNDGDPRTGQDLVKLALTTDAKPEPLVRTRFDEYGGAISPDGLRIAFVSNEPGRDEVFVMAASGGSRVQASRSGGTEPVWSADGRELVFRREQTFLSVAVPAGSDRLSDQRVLFTLPTRPGLRDSSYALLRDGRFLVLLAEETAGSSPVTVLLNRLTALGTR